MERKGQARLAVYLKQAQMDSLKDFARVRDMKITAAVEQALDTLLGGASANPTDERLASVEAQVAQLREMIADRPPQPQPEADGLPDWIKSAIENDGDSEGDDPQPMEARIAWMEWGLDWMKRNWQLIEAIWGCADNEICDKQNRIFNMKRSLAFDTARQGGASVEEALQAGEALKVSLQAGFKHWERPSKSAVLVAAVEPVLAGQADDPAAAVAPEQTSQASGQSEKKRKPQAKSTAQLVIAELAALGLGQKAIADELTARGFRTKAGKPIPRSDDRICTAVKAFKVVSH